MPQIKSAEKRVRSSQRKQLRNKSVRSQCKTNITKAEKLIFELQRKSKNFASLSTGQKQAPSIKNDALEALTSLGFDEKKASSLVDRLLKETPEASLEALVKQALRDFSA